MKIKLTTTILLIVAYFGAMGQTTKRPFRVYYVPFTEQQYFDMQKQVARADSLLLSSDAKAKDIKESLYIIGNFNSLFGQAYQRMDTLNTAPIVDPKKQQTKKP